ncbi:NAD(P)-dependent alcohol dehydrogenase [Haloferula sp. A504]|uniref:NADPH-dependent aldehyde reductase Ahr n=1 Tax=Haloferula sp. A504 TaxID=3373601 RepID=UPI0031BD7C57|nr:NAD(P)-dependent alcohol dehydrogenase [Verrucomicrobiaceae bacterium E54]
MSDSFHAWAATEASGKLQSFDYSPGELGSEQVELRVESCGICHSDLSMIDNEWGQSTYPLVAGHEVVGIVEAAGDHVKGVTVGDRVGLGWFAGSCMSCHSCLSGHHNLCQNSEQTIVGRHGGFADRVRCHWSWAILIPEGVDPAKAGPLFCGGITVFGPIAHYGVKPTDRVGVVGIGGLGHLALQFLDHWGCHVTAFTSTDSKADEARAFGADAVVNSRDDAGMKSIAGSLDFILVTANVPLDWEAYLGALRPDGRLHFVGAVLEPIPVQAFSLIGQRKSISGSPLGSPATVADMLEFCGRHGIAPKTEHFAFDQINDALDHLRAGKARYRVVLS